MLFPNLVRNLFCDFHIPTPTLKSWHRSAWKKHLACSNTFSDTLTFVDLIALNTRCWFPMAPKVHLRCARTDAHSFFLFWFHIVNLLRRTHSYFCNRLECMCNVLVTCASCRKWFTSAPAPDTEEGNFLCRQFKKWRVAWSGRAATNCFFSDLWLEYVLPYL